MIYLIYHGSDFDGTCSGFIARKFFESKGKIKDKDFKMIPTNYGNRLEVFPNSEDEIVMMDFTLQPYEEMVKLEKLVKSFVCIDHHISAYEKLKDMLDKKDYIYEADKAGCGLTWEFFFETQIPYFIQLLSDYDIWNNKDKERWEESILPFQYGMRAIETDPKDDVGYVFWSRLLEDSLEEKQIGDDDIVNDIIESGKNVYRYQQICNKYIVANAFDHSIDGLRLICCNSSTKGSQLFDSIWDENKYDAMFVFAWGKGQWSYSFYTTKNINLPQKIKSLKAQGHAKACGGQCGTSTLQTLGFIK